MKKLALAPIALALLSAALSGCVSLGKEPPPTLLTLTPSVTAPAGLSASGKPGDALAILDPDAPQKLDVTRVPVQVDASNVAYLKDAVWVEKPSRLFAGLLAETIRAKQTRMVIAGSDVRFAAATKLSGQLTEMTYDAGTGSVVVRFDAVLQQPGGEVMTRRFEAKVSGVLADPASVGPAMNEAANKVAADVASWIG